VKIIFAIDAIFPPLTGIGRYAWELASGLAKEVDAHEVKYFSHGRFLPNPTLEGLQQGVQDSKGAGAATTPLAARLRSRLALFAPAVKVYSAITPYVFGWRLREFSDHLYHSPNYFLPPFGGTSVATVHDLSWLLYPQFHPEARVAFMNTELPKTLRRATHLITDSEFIRQEVIAQLGWQPEKVTSIPLGVDANFHPRTPEQTQPVLDTYGLTHGAYTLCVATIEPRKNIDRLISAHQSLPPSLREQFPLVLVGSPGWNSESLHERIQKLAGHSLKYLNYVPQEHLCTLFAGARLFAFPSIYEGFGLPVLEAMASGCPVLISRNTCLSEVGGAAAWQVEPLDIDDIRDGLVHALQETQWRTEAITQGLQLANALTWKCCYERTRALYDRLQSHSP
jgi:alpha-1,3-rhamnosyl/mannosyltransferase